MQDFNEMPWLNVCLLIFDAVVTLFLLIGAAVDTNRKSPFMSSFIVLLVSNIFMQLGEAGIWLFEGMPDKLVLLNVSALTSLVFSYVLIASYAYCLTGFVRERAEISAWLAHVIAAMCAVFILLSVISLFNGMFLSFDSAGYFVYGQMYGLVRAFDLIAILMEILLVLKNIKILTLREVLCITSFSVLLLLSVAIQFIWDPIPEYMVTTLSLVVMYVLFHGETTRQLAEKKMQLARKERQLTESRISIMLSQIQPHFMYNMLTTIMYLCSTDPEEAENTVGQFAHYIRANMDSLTLTHCIPLENEMNHVKTYLELEKKRFGNRLKVELDIKENSFSLPALTIQPVVENAVKYGMTKKKKLTIRINTYSDDTNYYIEILDDGKGFDVNEVKNDGKSHIGIENVRNRLQMMCGGKLTIKSEPQAGTTAVISIPKLS
ncbi:MAG: sensor histidine kinase [Candidatus Ornithomonoglobus sp.]